MSGYNELQRIMMPSSDYLFLYFSYVFSAGTLLATSISRDNNIFVDWFHMNGGTTNAIHIGDFKGQ